MDLTSDNFQTEVMQSDLPVLVDFWAPWCGPCKMMSPIIDQVAEALAGKVKVAKVNVDENQGLAQDHSVMSIPTFVVFKGGQVVDQFSGAMTKEALQEKLEKHA
ncbi:MAG: thioredoxin [Candidatus Uhrbacteria bacterium]